MISHQTSLSFIVIRRKKYFHRSIINISVILSPIHVSTGDLHRWRKCYCLKRSPHQTFAIGKTAKGRLKGPERVADIQPSHRWQWARDRHALSLSISLHRLISGSSSLFHCLPFNTRVSTRRMRPTRTNMPGLYVHMGSRNIVVAM